MVLSLDFPPHMTKSHWIHGSWTELWHNVLWNPHGSCGNKLLEEIAEVGKQVENLVSLMLHKYLLNQFVLFTSTGEHKESKRGLFGNAVLLQVLKKSDIKCLNKAHSGGLGISFSARSRKVWPQGQSSKWSQNSVIVSGGSFHLSYNQRGLKMVIGTEFET